LSLLSYYHKQIQKNYLLAVRAVSKGKISNLSVAVVPVLVKNDLSAAKKSAW